MGSRVSEPASAAELRRPQPPRPPALRQNRDAPIAVSLNKARSSPGRPLPAGPRAAMEARFGHDFGHIRIHDDGAAADASDAVDARAYALGADLVFGAGEFAPESPSGARLLAHELAHAVQQEEAGEVDLDHLSSPDDAAEREADDAADAVLEGGEPRLSSPGGAAAVGRQQKEPAKTEGVPLEQIRERLKTYLAAELARQGGTKLKLTPGLQRTLDGLFDPKSSGRVNLQLFFTMSADRQFSPDELAGRVASYLPAEVSTQRAASLGVAPGPSSSSSTEPEPTRTDRVVDLLKKSSPADPSPEMQQSGWRFDQTAKDLRKNEPGVIGPYLLPDVFTVFRVAGGFKEAWKGPATKPVEPQSYDGVEKAVASINKSALKPAASGATASSTPTDSWADGQEAARGLARALDVGQKKNQSDVPFDLGSSYQSFPDKPALFDAFRAMVTVIRDALPHHASKVNAVVLYFGDKQALRVPLR